MTRYIVSWGFTACCSTVVEAEDEHAAKALVQQKIDNRDFDYDEIEDEMDFHIVDAYEENA